MIDCSGNYRTVTVVPYDLDRHPTYGIMPRPRLRPTEHGARRTLRRQILSTAVARGYSPDQAGAIALCYLMWTALP